MSGVANVAVAIPARDEEQRLPACLAALDAAAAVAVMPVTLVVIANGCTDGTARLLADTRLEHARLLWRAVSPLPGSAHAGWARRIAFDAAAEVLAAPGDLLLGTDADTLVAPDWMVRIARHVAAGADAVAGRAFTPRDERAAYGVAGKRRLDLLGRYYTAIDGLRAARNPDADDPWPRHHYEGGASMALTLGRYRRIGGAPVVPLGEDRALFAAVRASGGRVRHPVDVRVFTSCRVQGRAPGGMADTVARWLAQGEDEPLHETYALPAALDAQGAGEPLTFRMLPAALAQAQAAIRSIQSPQVEPVLVPALGRERVEPADRLGKRHDRLVAAQRVIGLARPVDEEQVAA